MAAAPVMLRAAWRRCWRQSRGWVQRNNRRLNRLRSLCHLLSTRNAVTRVRERFVNFGPIARRELKLLEAPSRQRRCFPYRRAQPLLLSQQSSKLSSPTKVSCAGGAEQLV